MIHLTHETQIWLLTLPIDFRKQTDGLIALCQNQYAHNPRSGALFVFINKGRTMIRILCYENNGYWLATKRLSRGYFQQFPKSNLSGFSKSLAEDLKNILNPRV